MSREENWLEKSLREQKERERKNPTRIAFRGSAPSVQQPQQPFMGWNSDKPQQKNFVEVLIDKVGKLVATRGKQVVTGFGKETVQKSQASGIISELRKMAIFVGACLVVLFVLYGSSAFYAASLISVAAAFGILYLVTRVIIFKDLRQPIQEKDARRIAQNCGDCLRMMKHAYHIEPYMEKTTERFYT